jgi:DivIVA domain-containing protein
VFVLLVILALAVVAGVSLLLVGEQGRMPDAPPDREPADLPADRPVTRDDLDRVRFAVGFRGYRMDQVDAVLDRVAGDVTALMERNQVLEDQLRGAGIEPAARPAVEEPVADAPSTQGEGVPGTNIPVTGADDVASVES